jgi:deoxyadenosine/deoxycytidine kinase
MNFSEMNQLDVPLMQIYVTVIILWFCVFLCVITYDTKKSRKYIFFDGIIGAGKTTLIKLLEENMKKSGYKAKAIYEPVDEWEKSGALKLFYQDIVKHCYEFQTYTFITRVERLLNEIYEEEDIEYYLIERSIFTDKYIFVEMLKDIMGPIRMTMYNKWWAIWKHIMPFQPTLLVLLDTGLEESMNRINERNREGENGKIEPEYQKKLHKQHLDFYNSLKDIPDLKDIPSIMIDKKYMNQNFKTNNQHNSIKYIRNKILNLTRKPNFIDSL